MKHRAWQAIPAAAALLAGSAAVAGSGIVIQRGTVLGMPSARAPAPTADKGPMQGMSMAQVIRQYGQPERRYGPVGDPPITRWTYSGFSVYFEYDTVLHTVVPGNPPPLYHRDELLSGR